MTDLLQGTLDLLVLKVLQREPMHGWGICERVGWMSEEVFRVNQGSLYPALQRLKRKGLVRAYWDTTENNRRARYYELTRKGLTQLAKEEARWAQASTAVNLVLKRAEEG